MEGEETPFSRWTMGKGIPGGNIECKEQYRRANLGCGVAQPLEGIEGWMIRGLAGQG